MDSERDARLRRLLVATVEVAPAPRRRPTRRVLAAGLAAFVLAGGLTGGAVAAMARVGDGPSESVMRSAVEASAGPFEKVLGPSYFFDGSSPSSLRIDRAPDGADRLRVSLDCGPGGRATLTLDGQMLESGDCGGVTMVKTSTASSHTLSVTPDTGAGYVLFAVWVKSLAAPPSAQSKRDVEDGHITRPEYENAYSRYAGCMAGLGYPVEPLWVGAAVLSPNPTPEGLSSGASELCYNREFFDVDRVWQLAHER